MTNADMHETTSPGGCLAMVLTPLLFVAVVVAVIFAFAR